jgi:hypothetical protein
MVTEARKSHHQSVSDCDESTQLPSPSSPPRAKALPLQLRADSFAPGSASVPAPLLEELAYREYWTERAWLEGELADVASAAARSAHRSTPPESAAEPVPAPGSSIRLREADPSDVGEDPWGLAR